LKRHIGNFGILALCVVMQKISCLSVWRYNCFTIQDYGSLPCWNLTNSCVTQSFVQNDISMSEANLVQISRTTA